MTLNDRTRDDRTRDDRTRDDRARHDRTRDHHPELRRFADLLLKWNPTLNLIAAGDADVVWQRHIADSLQLATLMPAGIGRAIDLGSGGGFPGLVLAIATGVTFDLIESDRRKAAFLRTAILETGAPAVVHCCRIEDAGVATAPLVTARALAPRRVCCRSPHGCWPTAGSVCS